MSNHIDEILSELGRRYKRNTMTIAFPTLFLFWNPCLIYKISFWGAKLNEGLLIASLMLILYQGGLWLHICFIDYKVWKFTNPPLKGVSNFYLKPILYIKWEINKAHKNASYSQDELCISTGNNTSERYKPWFVKIKKANTFFWFDVIIPALVVLLAISSLLYTFLTVVIKGGVLLCS